MSLAPVDYAVMALYVACVLGIGWRFRRQVPSSSDFLLSSRTIPGWVSTIALLTASLGGIEIIGISAIAAQYGMMAAHFFWIGSVPAMLFLGLYMMPIYYSSGARTVPEYLKLRFDRKTHLLGAVGFAAMLVFSGGVSLYLLGTILEILLDWKFSFSVLFTASIVVGYILAGGLRAAVYVQVVQFFFILLGLTPLMIWPLRTAGGWETMAARSPAFMTHSWRNMINVGENPMGVEVFGMTAGLGFVLSFGYWCADFRIVQRAMAARSLSAARSAPILAAIPRMFMAFLVIVPGVVAVSLTRMDSQYALPMKWGWPAYDQVLPSLMMRFYPSGMFGLGLAALGACFMSGLAASLTAFNAVATYDVYQTYLRKHQPDAHYLSVGRFETILGGLLWIAVAYMAHRSNSALATLQLDFEFISAPVFATFLLGMFWKRPASAGAFTGLIAGVAAAAATSLAAFPTRIAQTFWVAIVAWTVCFALTILISLITRPRPNEELRGLVWDLVEKPHGKMSWLAGAAVAVLLALNLWFW